MRNLIKILCLVTLAFAPQVFSADYFVAVDGGRSTVSIDQKHLADEYSDHDIRTTLLSVNGGMVFESDIVFGVGYLASGSDNFFEMGDTYDLTQEQIFVGYRFPVAKHFRITPNFGLNHWSMKVKQGVLLNSHREFKNFSGNDYFGQLNLEFPINHLITVFGSYTRTNYDFGNLNSLKAGVIFEFN